jgi:hypothetical protein
MLTLSWRQCSRIALAMVTKSPITKESTKETVKTIRAGNAGALAIPVATKACVLFYFSHARPRVRPKHPAFPAPSNFQGRARRQDSGEITPRESGGVS